MNPVDKFNLRADKINSLLCVGLDPIQPPLFQFNKRIIDQTAEYAAAFKPNIAFYEAHGHNGLAELKKTMDYLHANHPDIFTICDAKRADIGSTNKGYVQEIFDYFGFDAVTLHPYLGREALEPFLSRKDKISIILCRTSNPGAGELQDLQLGNNNKKLWEIVAEKVAKEWNENSNCMLVTGATYPEEIAGVRKIVGNMTLLIPGIGAQGGNIKDAIEAGLNSQRKGLIINSSRGIIFAENPKVEAEKLRDEINEYR